MSSTVDDSQLKARHRAMWASGDYPSMVETFLTPLGPQLIEAAGIGSGMKVLDVAAGTGNSSIPAAQTGADAFAHDFRVAYATDAIGSPQPQLGSQILSFICDEYRQECLSGTAAEQWLRPELGAKAELPAQ